MLDLGKNTVHSLHHCAHYFRQQIKRVTKVCIKRKCSQKKKKNKKHEEEKKEGKGEEGMEEKQEIQKIEKYIDKTEIILKLWYCMISVEFYPT